MRMCNSMLINANCNEMFQSSQRVVLISIEEIFVMIYIKGIIKNR